ncbi:uncharacterized protein BJ171DRAFT_174375 [Polychytrium aggregatum]|uniref:uncharacterized protein n=1 Tax=Polychytrium aggregatum TaxID=110093 RepID=UPI0022FED583|nr:uncharacterized protein BJ171DRAFT_174375 [Polychytrium aggregatum]KAI9209042.1 hypothetical protein BJ171DRAFT_174375 [Polychytrium aggregatum]
MHARSRGGLLGRLGTSTGTADMSQIDSPWPSLAALLRRCPSSRPRRPRRSQGLRRSYHSGQPSVLVPPQSDNSRCRPIRFAGLINRISLRPLSSGVSHRPIAATTSRPKACRSPASLCPSPLRLFAGSPHCRRLPGALNPNKGWLSSLKTMPRLFRCSLLLLLSLLLLFGLPLYTKWLL